MTRKITVTHNNDRSLICHRTSSYPDKTGHFVHTTCTNKQLIRIGGFGIISVHTTISIRDILTLVKLASSVTGLWSSPFTLLCFISYVGVSWHWWPAQRWTTLVFAPQWTSMDCWHLSSSWIRCVRAWAVHSLSADPADSADHDGLV